MRTSLTLALTWALLSSTAGQLMTFTVVPSVTLNAPATSPAPTVIAATAIDPLRVPVATIRPSRPHPLVPDPPTTVPTTTESIIHYLNRIRQLPPDETRVWAPLAQGRATTESVIELLNKLRQQTTTSSAPTTGRLILPLSTPTPISSLEAMDRNVSELAFVPALSLFPEYDEEEVGVSAILSDEVGVSTTLSDDDVAITTPILSAAPYSETSTPSEELTTWVPSITALAEPVGPTVPETTPMVTARPVPDATTPFASYEIDWVPPEPVDPAWMDPPTVGPIVTSEDDRASDDAVEADTDPPSTPTSADTTEGLELTTVSEPTSLGELDPVAEVRPSESEAASSEWQVAVVSSIAVLLVVLIVAVGITFFMCRSSISRKNVYTTMEYQPPQHFTRPGPPVILEHEIEAVKQHKHGGPGLAASAQKITEL